ncbi:hypothetical protein [Nodosilinea sp. E11]|uniref:hypothetical protein n=1 Tax=Nodosilinea sp. E11 TaxID=3037479 RepID=UPI0029343690|nr:hypothetical protein [Nodosilinea sp. E11]WOD37159.1 hypothetical protein RRF56_01500 [Nodosilinea sp. E11]
MEVMDEVIVLVYDCPETTSVPLSIRANWIRQLYPTVKLIEPWDRPTEIDDTPEIQPYATNGTPGLRLGLRIVSRILSLYAGDIWNL